jgi:hypothetical protein
MGYLNLEFQSRSHPTLNQPYQINRNINLYISFSQQQYLYMHSNPTEITDQEGSESPSHISSILNVP